MTAMTRCRYLLAMLKNMGSSPSHFFFGLSHLHKQRHVVAWSCESSQKGKERIAVKINRVRLFLFRLVGATEAEHVRRQHARPAATRARGEQHRDHVPVDVAPRYVNVADSQRHRYEVES